MSEHGAIEGVHVSSIRFNAMILGALLLLTGFTYATALLDLGFLDTPLALVIAFSKTALVMLFFMHVRWGSNYTKFVSVIGFVFLIFLFAFTLADVMTRTREQPWNEHTWPGAAHRAGAKGDPSLPKPSVEGVTPQVVP